MKKLGKTIKGHKRTIQAFACYCYCDCDCDCTEVVGYFNTNNKTTQRRSSWSSINKNSNSQ